VTVALQILGDDRVGEPGRLRNGRTRHGDPAAYGLLDYQGNWSPLLFAWYSSGQPCAYQAGPLGIDRSGKDPESVGRAFEGVELRVASPKGERLPAAEVGPIWVRSRALSTVAVPKIHLPKRDEGVPIGGLDDGWLRTGDLGQQDRAGRVVITGREDDLVKVDGKRVALGEVEGCLEAFPKVKAAQARIVTDDMGGPMVVARVVRAGVCKAEDIIDHCARNLAPYKVPRQIEFCEVI